MALFSLLGGRLGFGAYNVNISYHFISIFLKAQLCLLKMM
jgi:hypothetical protein